MVDHEAQCAKDEEGRRQTLNRKYWQTHDYDPVAGVRVDEAEVRRLPRSPLCGALTHTARGQEREAQRQRRRQEEERGAREPITRMPPSVRCPPAARGDAPHVTTLSPLCSTSTARRPRTT